MNAIPARKYVCAIKNNNKRRYAYDYLDWITSGSSLRRHPDPGHESYGGLSTMAAQAVRMNIELLLSGVDIEGRPV